MHERQVLIIFPGSIVQLKQPKESDWQRRQLESQGHKPLTGITAFGHVRHPVASQVAQVDGQF